MNELLKDEGFLSQIAFIGQTLGPFYLEDPKNGIIAPALEAVRDIEVTAAAAEWPFVSDDDAAAFLSKMKDGLAEGIDTEDLIWEYRRLFIGPAVKPAPPWGSVYTDRECVVFGESTLELRQWMRKNGIERLGEPKDPEDHIGLMLLLMTWLAENKPDALEEYLRLHLLTWSSHFLDLLAQAAEHPFYEGLALLTKESLEGIQEALEISVVYPRYFR